MSSNSTTEKYGFVLPADYDRLSLEFAMMRKPEWELNHIKSSLFFHYRAAQSLLWPEDDHHRWSDLILKEILQNDITVLAGPKDSSKTYTMAKYALTDYFCHPENTLIIISSTDLRSLEGRVWGCIKGLYRRAKLKYPWLPGVVLDSKHAICTDDLDNDDEIIRDMRKGCLCIPCKNSSGGQTNIAAYVGMKQERKRYLADEFQFMSRAMYDSIANANSGNFKMVCAGNPIAQGDPLDIISEPKVGWDAMAEPTKTEVWDNLRFLRSRTVNLVGIDSPNFDLPENEPIKYWYLVNRDSISRTVAGYGKNSHQYYSQCLGVRRSGVDAHKVLTRALCQEHRAFDAVVWDHKKPLTKVFGLDAAYGGIGGDRCIGGHIEYGTCDDGKLRIFVVPPRQIFINLKKPESPEDQIALWVKNYCEEFDIPAKNCFYDSTGRGSLGTAFARLWSAMVNPVEFGGMPSKRPVTHDLFITDERSQIRRLKRCDEHYRKFVTELWWTVRLIIESDQMRGMTDDLVWEGSMREWKEVAGNRIEIESKTDMKERMGMSPDLFDWLVCACEGSRRLGFQITKFADKDKSKRKLDWLDEKALEYKQFLHSRELKAA